MCYTVAHNINLYRAAPRFRSVEVGRASASQVGYSLMTRYRRESDGKEIRAVVLYGFLKSQKWALVTSDEDRRVVEDAEGEVMVLRKIPGTEERAFGPHPYVPGTDGPT